MAKFVFIFTDGPGDTPPSDDVMDIWMSWFNEIGPSIIDMGNPFGPSATVSSGGVVTTGAVSRASGYTVINAADLESATEIAKGCPIFAGGGAVEVCEALEM